MIFKIGLSVFRYWEKEPLILREVNDDLESHETIEITGVIAYSIYGIKLAECKPHF